MIPNINTNNRDNLALLHLNIHSIFYKLDRFSNFLGSVALKFSVIGIYETWLDDSSNSSDIHGFNFIHNHRVGRNAGGYLADYLEFKHRVDLVFSKDCAESLFVENNRTMVKSIVIRQVIMILPWLMEILLRSVQLFTIAFFPLKKS